MTEKELHRLKRPDLLALLVAQGRETAALQEKLKGTEEALQAAEELTARLKTRLDEKDAQLERLKARLNDKDAQLARLKARLDEKDDYIALLEKRVEDFDAGDFLKMENVQSLSEVSYCLHFVLRAAQKSVDDYLRRAQAPLPLELQATGPSPSLPVLDPAPDLPGAGREDDGPAAGYGAFDLDLGRALSWQPQRAQAGSFDPQGPGGDGLSPGPQAPGARGPGGEEAPPFRLGDFLDEGAAAVP